MDRYVKNSLDEYDKLYEQNIGIIEVSESIDIRLFKTSIANKLMDDGFGVLYMSYRHVIIRIKQNIMSGEAYERIVGRYKNTKVLLIDDFLRKVLVKVILILSLR